MTRKRKLLLGIVLLVSVLAVSAYIFREDLGERLFAAAVDANVGRDEMAALPDGLHVALCGSGSPLSDPTRAGPCTIVIAGDRMFVVDAGSGSARNFGPMGMPIGEIDALFLTHFHSDHIDGLGEMMLLRWTGAGAARPLPVYGPYGVGAIVDGLNGVYAADTGYRIAHHGEEVVPPSGAGGAARPFEFAEGQVSAVVYEGGGVTVTAFAVDHDPVKPSVGYRFDYKGRSVVISGDTAPSQNVADACNGCDILVHEALNEDMVKVIRDKLAQDGDARLVKILDDIPGYHTTPEQAAGIAKDGKARMLVLSHIVPALPGKLLEPYFVKGGSDIFSAPIVVGRDGMIFTLPAGSDRMERSNLM